MRSILVAVFVGFTAVLVAHAGDTNRLRLVLDQDGKTFDQFTVKDGWILVASENDTGRAPEYAAWRLEGDFLRHAIDMCFMPTHTISRQKLPEWKLASMERPYEVGIQLNQAPRLAAWPDEDLNNAIAIFAWIVDRKPVRVFAMDANSMRDAWIRFAISDDERRGFPTIMLHDGASFKTPRPWFADAGANNFVVGMHFGGTEVLETMIQQVSRVNERGRSDHTLLHVAAAAGRADAISGLVERKAKTENKDRTGQTPLALAAANGRLTAVRSLLALGADPDRISADGRPPLFWAIINGHDEVANELISADTNWRQRGMDEKDAVLLAIESGRANIVRRLADAGGLKRHQNELPEYLVRNIVLERLETVKALLDHGVNPDSMDATGAPAIVLAANTGLAPMVNAVLAAGADPDRTDGAGSTALMNAVRGGFKDSVIALLEGGANPNATDRDGNTAVHVAVSSNNVEMIGILAAHKADLGSENSLDDTAFDLAWKAGNKTAADALVVAGLHFKVENPHIMQRLERAISMDLGELIERAIEDGWDPSQRFQKTWPISVVAEYYSALRTTKFLQETVPPTTAPPIVSASELSSPPLPRNVSNPVDPRPADQNDPKVTVTVRGLLDAEGNFLFPRITSSPDERLTLAVRDIIPTWQFLPGSISGRPANTQLTLPVTFPARMDRIYTREEVDTPPKVYRGTAIVSVPAWELEDIRKKQDSSIQKVENNRINSTPYVVELPAKLPDAGTAASHVVSFVVERNGRPSGIEILTPVTDEDRKTILAAVERYEFSPARHDGNIVRVRLITKVTL